MSKIEGYGSYQSSFYSNVLKNKDAGKAQNNSKADKTEKNSSVNLSEKAKKLLEELKKQYSNMDFIIADYEDDEEAAAYLSRGTKEFSVLIDPETLEEMAADEETKNKYIGILEDSVSQLTDMKEQLGDKADEVTRIGITVGKDGQVSFFAEMMENAGAKQKEFIENLRESRKEAKTEQEKKAQEELAAQERTKKTTVTAGSVEELLEKINAVDWSQIKSEDRPEAGSRFDFSV